MRAKLLLLCCFWAGTSAFAELMWRATSQQRELGVSDTDAEFVFVFVNSGDLPVRILSTKASCGCTALGPTGAELVAPGAKGEIKAVFQVGQRQGRHRSQVTVETSEVRADGSLSAPVTHNLEITVDIPVVVELRPGFLRWAATEAGQSKSASLVPNAEHGVRIGEIKASDERLALSVTEQADGSRMVSVTPGPELFAQGFTGFIEAATNIGRSYRVFVSVEKQGGQQ